MSIQYDIQFFTSLYRDSDCLVGSISMQTLSVLSEDHGGNSQPDNISVTNKNDHNFCCEKQRDPFTIDDSLYLESLTYL